MDDITASVLAAVPRDAQSMVDVRLAETSSCAGDDDSVALERELGHDGGIDRTCGVTGDSSVELGYAGLYPLIIHVIFASRCDRAASRPRESPSVIAIAAGARPYFPMFHSYQHTGDLTARVSTGQTNLNWINIWKLQLRC